MTEGEKKKHLYIPVVSKVLLKYNITSLGPQNS